VIARLLDRLADMHPRLAVALLCVGFWVLVAAAVSVVFVTAAASFIFFLGT
jgi:hypothetical protein